MLRMKVLLWYCFKHVFLNLILKGNGDTATKKKGLVIMTGVAKKKPEVRTKKPEVMEQNQDALEYSSEEEVDIDDLKDKLKEKGKKDLVKIDHTGIDYEDFRLGEIFYCKYLIVLFRKDFYIEVPDLAKMTDAEVEEYRQEMEGIKVEIIKF